MPHLFTSRYRPHNIINVLIKDAEFNWSFLANAIYLFSSVLFVIGSVFFLPSMSSYGSLGAKIFTTGVILTLLLNIHDIYESIHNIMHVNFTVWHFYEIISACLYGSGTFSYLIGNYYFIYHPSNEYASGLWFLIGSVIFTVAAIVNVMQVIKEDSYRKLMLMNATAICSIIGSLLFTVASIPYLWSTSLDNLYVLMGWEFIAASSMYLIGGIFSALHTKLCYTLSLIKISDQ